MSDQEHKKEERAKRRYQISTLAQFRWRRAEGTWTKASGVTQNISGSGVCILSSSQPAVGTPVEVRVTVPSMRESAAAAVYIGGKGVVVRATPNVGFAAQVAFRLHRVEQAEL